MRKMKNRQKDVVSESSDIDSDNNSETSEVNGSHVDKSTNRDINPGKERTCSDSENKRRDVNTVNKNSTTRISEIEAQEDSNEELSEEDTNLENSVVLKSIFHYEDLTSDDEIYVFQCPATYNGENLLGKNLLGKTKQTVDNKTEVYQSELINCEKKFITLALPNKSGGGTLVKLPLKGHIIIDKVVEITVGDDKTEENHDLSKVVSPKDIKTRHPLLGVNWEAHIKEANEALERSSFVKKSKKIKKEKISDIEVDINPLKRENSIVEHVVPEKKKKKHK